MATDGKGESMDKVKIIIIDDHEVVLRGLRMQLQNEPNMEVIGEASNGVDGVDKTASLKPDVVIIDLQLPRMNGIEAIRQITLNNQKVKVIAYSFYDDESTVLSAFHAGATGYVLKSAGLNELIEAIKNTLAGHRYLGSPLPDLAIDALINLRRTSPRDPYSLLTPREKEVLQLVAEQNSNAEIAQKLFISRRTVEIHRSHIMRKLGLHRPQVDLIRYAAERGLIKPLYNVPSN
jgi:DNA-binding NarL/FixJ family response regulator